MTYYYSSVTSKGTVTLPAEARKRLGIEPGMRVVFEENAQGLVVRRVPTIEELRSENQAYMKRNNIKPLSDEELAAAVETARAESAVARYRRALP